MSNIFDSIFVSKEKKVRGMATEIVNLINNNRDKEIHVEYYGRLKEEDVVEIIKHVRGRCKHLNGCIVTTSEIIFNSQENYKTL